MRLPVAIAALASSLFLTQNSAEACTQALGFGRSSPPDQAAVHPQTQFLIELYVGFDPDAPIEENLTALLLEGDEGRPVGARVSFLGKAHIVVRPERPLVPGSEYRLTLASVRHAHLRKTFNYIAEPPNDLEPPGNITAHYTLDRYPGDTCVGPGTYLTANYQPVPQTSIAAYSLIEVLPTDGIEHWETALVSTNKDNRVPRLWRRVTQILQGRCLMVIAIDHLGRWSNFHEQSCLEEVSADAGVMDVFVPKPEDMGSPPMPVDSGFAQPDAGPPQIDQGVVAPDATGLSGQGTLLAAQKGCACSSHGKSQNQAPWIALLFLPLCFRLRRKDSHHA